ncbi:30S ribosomal protein S16 [candidate division KSB1 bacterium]|nr:30S ribosomal protein S16 [candidate division KSB1 bacterium]
MSVKIRLARGGRKKQPHYRIVVMDSRNRRDGAFVDQIGIYHPKRQPAQFQIDEARAMHWLAVGATPSETVRSLLSQHGLMLKLDLLKRDTSADQIDAAMAKWRADAQARATQAAARRTARREKKAKAAAEPPKS